MYEKGKISIIAGRPGMGKTSFAIKNANELQEFYGKNVLYIDLESNARLIKSNNNKFIVIGNVDNNKIYKFIEEEYTKRKEEGRALDVVFIDYLQLVINVPKLKDNKFDNCIKEFKKIAKKLNIHIALLTQCERVEDGKDLGRLPEYIVANLDSNTELIYVYNFKFSKKNKLNSTKSIKTMI